MSDIPVASRTRSKSSGFQSLQPGSAAARPLLTLPTNMAPEQQDDLKRDSKGDDPLTELFPSFDRALGTVLRDTFDVLKESNSTLCEALLSSQYRTWADFLLIENIGDLTYEDRGSRMPLSKHVQLNLQQFTDFGRHLTQKGLDWEDHSQYTKEACCAYCWDIIMANRESSADRLVANHGTDGSGRWTKLFDQLKYESWIRKSRDESTFPVLQNDARFKHWLVKFKAKLETTDINTTTFLNPNWPDIPLTGYTKALHAKQCAFFWTLVLHVFQSNLSSSCVLSHTSTRNGRQAFFDFVKLHNRSKSKVYDTSIVMQHLLDIDLKSWKDTKVEFITQWFAQLEHLNKLRPPQRPLDYNTVKTHPCKACSSSFQLSEQFCKVSDPPEAQDIIRFRPHEATAISELKNILLLKATRLDSQASLSQPSSRPSVKAHPHNLSSLTQTTYLAITDDTDPYSPLIDFDGDYQDYAVYKAGRTPDPSTRLSTTVWQTLSKHGMKHWLGFTADNNKKLVACLRSDLLADTLLDPNSTKPITRRACEHDVQQTLPPEDEASLRDAFHASLGVYKAASQSDSRPLKSSVSPAHPEVLYKKEGNVYVPPCVFPGTPTAVYHSNKTNVHT
eukprot:jgi/Psemu1/25530/gm1.25530_g